MFRVIQFNVFKEIGHLWWFLKQNLPGRLHLYGDLSAREAGSPVDWLPCDVRQRAVDLPVNGGLVCPALLRNLRSSHSSPLCKQNTNQCKISPKPVKSLFIQKHVQPHLFQDEVDNKTFTSSPSVFWLCGNWEPLLIIVDNKATAHDGFLQIKFV